MYNTIFCGQEVDILEKEEQAKALREMTRKMARNLSLLDRDRASCCGVTLAQCHAIVEIGRVGVATPSFLATTLRLDKSTVTRLADSLVEQEFVLRSQNPGDRRSVTLSLTEKGLRFFEGTENSMNSFFLSVIERIPENDRKAFLSGLGSVVEALERGECVCFDLDRPLQGRREGECTC